MSSSRREIARLERSRGVEQRRNARAISRSWLACVYGLAALTIVTESASAAGALFRAKRTWWFSNTSSWTDGYMIPPSGKSPGMAPYEPPATAYVGDTPGNPRFTAPKSFIKNTTYYFECWPCYTGYPYSWTRAWYSYWNAKGSFRPQNANAPTTTTTIRFRTTMSEPYKPTRWQSNPHTARNAPVTPTTTWGGRYDFSRGGSIMIWPGSNRFGGTMRFFEGPNDRIYRRTRRNALYSTSIRPKPLPQQLGTGVEIELGEVTEATVALAYRLTQLHYVNRSIIGTTPMGGPQYYVQEIHYLVTRAPYTTGKVRAWEPLGNTNTIQTGTGYDNRTGAGLNGTISMVHPRLVHAYRVPMPGSGKPIKMVWSSARLRKIDFRFLPEPAGISILTTALVALAGLGLTRRR